MIDMIDMIDMIEASGGWHGPDMRTAPRRARASTFLTLALAVAPLLFAGCAQEPSCYGERVGDLPEAVRAAEASCVSSWTESLPGLSQEWAVVTEGESSSGSASMVGLAGDRLAFVKDSELSMYDSSGEPLWTFGPVFRRLGAGNIAQLSSGALVIGDTFGTTDVELLLLDADTGQQLNQIAMGPQLGSFTPLVVADGERVWVLNREEAEDESGFAFYLRYIDPVTETVERDFLVPVSDSDGAWSMGLAMNAAGDLGVLSGQTLRVIDSETGEVEGELTGEDISMFDLHPFGDGWLVLGDRYLEERLFTVATAYDASLAKLWETEVPVEEGYGPSGVALLADGGVAFTVYESHYIEKVYEDADRPLIVVLDDQGQFEAVERVDVLGRPSGIVETSAGELVVAGSAELSIFSGLGSSRFAFWLANMSR